LNLSLVDFIAWIRARGALPIPSYFDSQMRAKELKRRLSSQSHVFSGLDESKANKLTLEPILSCFYSPNESQRCSPDLELFSQPDKSKRAEKMLELAIYKARAKELKRCLSSPCPKTFQAWMRLRRLKSQHSTYPRLFS
jgi:hypothetical protein